MSHGFPQFIFFRTHFIFHLRHSAGNKVVHSLCADECADMDTSFIQLLWKRLNSNQTGEGVNASDQVTLYPLAMHLVSDKGKDYSLPLYIKEWPVEIWFTTVFGFLLYSNTSQIEEDFKSIKAEEYVLFYPLDLQVRHRQMDHSHPKKWIKGWQLSSNDCGSSRIRQTVNMTYWTWREQWMLLLLAYPDWTLC